MNNNYYFKVKILNGVIHNKNLLFDHLPLAMGISHNEDLFCYD